MIFETLRDINVNGKVKEWSISVQNNTDHSVIKIIYGYVGGKIVESLQLINSGKNIGKSNQTTHYEQAIMEAKSKWKKKFDSLRKNTSVDNHNHNHTSTHTHVTQNIFPMLAQDFFKHKGKIVYPVYIQPKLDGYRMIYNGKVKSCTSRQGKEFDIITKTELYKELLKIPKEFTLDGELYVHNGIFEHLGILRKKITTQDDLEKLNKIEYHVYDVIENNTSYKDRYTTLHLLFQKNTFTKIKLVTTSIVHSEQELNNMHSQYVNDNYEGSIIRNMQGQYKCKARSTDLLKYKDFKDCEFEIVGYTFEKDTSIHNENLIVWVCKTLSGNTFHVRPKGTKEERQELYKKGDTFIGKFLQVKYFELTEGNVPRFPTTKCDTFTMYIRETIE